MKRLLHSLPETLRENFLHLVARLSITTSYVQFVPDCTGSVEEHLFRRPEAGRVWHEKIVRTFPFISDCYPDRDIVGLLPVEQWATSVARHTIKLSLFSG